MVYMYSPKSIIRKEDIVAKVDVVTVLMITKRRTNDNHIPSQNNFLAKAPVIAPNPPKSPPITPEAYGR